MTAALLLLCAVGFQDTRFAKLMVPWNPDEDPPFYAIRKEIEPYAYRTDLDYLWLRNMAINATNESREYPKDPRLLYCAFLWNKVLQTVFPDRGDDMMGLYGLKWGWAKLDRIPHSAEFSRYVATAMHGDEQFRTLGLRLVRKYPKDGLLLSWMSHNVILGYSVKGGAAYGPMPDEDLRRIEALGKDFLKNHPTFWPARSLWAILPMATKNSDTLRDQLDGYREAYRRMLPLRKLSHGSEWRQRDVKSWLERLPRYISQYEKLIKEGKGNVKVKDFPGGPK